MKKFGVGTYGPIRRPRIRLFKGGQIVIRLSLGRRLVNLLAVSPRTKAFINGVVDRPWVVGREFDSHVHHEKRFFKEKFISSCQDSDRSLSLGAQRL